MDAYPGMPCSSAYVYMDKYLNYGKIWSVTYQAHLNKYYMSKRDDSFKYTLNKKALFRILVQLKDQLGQRIEIKVK